MSLYRLCPHCLNKDSITRLITASGQITDHDATLFQDVHRNLHQSLLRISLLTLSNSVQLRPLNGTLQPYKTGGYFLRSALTVCEVLNATYTLIPRKSYTLRRSNGTLEPGIFKDLEEGAADLAAAGAITLESYKVVEFASPLGHNFYTFFHAAPRPMFTLSNIFHPLSSLLWLSLLVTIISILISLRVIYMVCPKRLQLWPFGRTSAFVLASCVLQCNENPRRYPLRVFVFHWYLFVIVVTTGYCAKLYEIFVDPPTEPAPETFALLGYSDYRIGFVDIGDRGVTLSSHFIHSKEGSGERKVLERWVGMSSRECVETALTEHKFACIFFGENQANFMAKLNEKYGTPSNGQSLLERSRDSALPYFITLLFPKGSLLRPTINDIVGHIAAGNLMDHWKRATDRELRQERWEAGHKLNRSAMRVENPALEYGEVWYIFELVTLGLIASAFGLFCEFWYNYHEETIRDCKVSITNSFKRLLKCGGRNNLLYSPNQPSVKDTGPQNPVTSTSCPKTT